jgi:hypothetical protein
MDPIFEEEEVSRARLALFLQHFSRLKDEREPCALLIRSRRSCCR